MKKEMTNYETSARRPERARQRGQRARAEHVNDRGAGVTRVREASGRAGARRHDSARRTAEEVMLPLGEPLEPTRRTRLPLAETKPDDTRRDMATSAGLEPLPLGRGAGNDIRPLPGAVSGRQEVTPPEDDGTRARRCQVTHYGGVEEARTLIMTLSEALALDLERYDFVYAPCFGKVGLRLPTGMWMWAQRHQLGPCPKGCKCWVPGRGLGPKTLKILQALQFEVPVTLTPEAIADATGVEEYRYGRGRLQARIAALRGFFGDSVEVQAYITTAKEPALAYGWNPARGWVWIDYLPVAVDRALTLP